MYIIKAAAILMLCASLLAGCDGDSQNNQGLEAWSLVAEKDECGVAYIVENYLETSERRNALHRVGAVFKQDRDAMLRLKHRDIDRHILKYIVRDDQFRLLPGCTSEFQAQEIVNDTPYGSLEKYFFQATDGNKLCRLTPFRHTGTDATPFDDMVTSGFVQSCIDVNSYQTTFDVLYDD